MHSGSQVVGVEVRGQSEKIDLEEVQAETLEGHDKATVLRVAHDAKEVKAKQISGTGLVAEHTGLSPVVQIEAPDTKLS